MTNVLKPCPNPWCLEPMSALALHYPGSGDTWSMTCRCGVKGPFSDTRENAAAMWNIRSPAPGAAAMREAVARVADAAARQSFEDGDADFATAYQWLAAALRALPAPEVPECHGCKHWTVDKQAKDFDKSNQYGTCRGMRGCGVEIETTGDCSVDAICTDATFCCKGWEAR